MKIEHVAALQETLERMETQQLDAMLLEELRKESPSGELIRMVGSILKERDRELVPEIDDNIRQAWEQYQRKAQPVKKKPKGLNSILVKAASLILVLLTLMALVPQEADASNFFQRLIAWTEDMFSLINPSEKTVPEDAYVFRTDNPGLQEVYNKVTELGVTEPVVPMWLPEGYELVACKVNITPSNSYMVSSFHNGNTELLFRINLYSDNVTSSYYKDGEIVLEKEMHGTKHTILQNTDFLTAVWVTDNIECFICVDCQEDTLIHILESIYMMEEN